MPLDISQDALKILLKTPQMQGESQISYSLHRYLRGDAGGGGSGFDVEAALFRLPSSLVRGISLKGTKSGSRSHSGVELRLDVSLYTRGGLLIRSSIRMPQTPPPCSSGGTDAGSPGNGERVMERETLTSTSTTLEIPSPPRNGAIVNRSF
jgi:hypothetical protein